MNFESMPQNSNRQDGFPSSLLDWLAPWPLVRLTIAALADTRASGQSGTAKELAFAGLLCYGYATGVYESGEVEWLATHDLRARYLSLNTVITADQIRFFRRRHRPLTEASLSRVLELAASRRGKRALAPGLSLDCRMEARKRLENAVQWDSAAADW